MDSIVSKYRELKEVYESYTDSLRILLESLLRSHEYEIHSVSSRVKSLSSLEGKIRDKSSYSKLEDITDISGIRIITHYSDDVDKIAKLIESEFAIDSENSIDKRAILEPDRFGYLSLHYVVSLSTSRVKLTEYKEYKGLKSEIQVRSLLQHTWAEIEHDIGYKSSIEIPKSVKRQFSRLAGLLELADSEFIAIRNTLTGYESKVKEEIQEAPETLDLNSISLAEYIKSSKLVKRLDKYICDTAGMEADSPNKEFVSRILQGLDYFGIDSFIALESKLEENEHLIKKRVEQPLNGGVVSGSTSFGISIVYLTQVLAGLLPTIEQTENYTRHKNYGDAERFAHYLRRLVKDA
jgi:ppGpp synthetase/RelA/SpoT-type nucleotidyltranferase